MANWAFVGNSFVPDPEARISVHDLALQRGYAVFDFMRLAGNEPFHGDDHIRRFLSSAAHMHLPVGYSEGQLSELVKELAERNNQPGTGIRCMLTGGIASDDGTFHPTLVISQHPLEIPSSLMYESGIRLATYPYQRQLPYIKTTDYIMSIWLQPFLRSRQADDVLYVNRDMISECPRSNIFIVDKNRRIITPGKMVLEGITRSRVLQAARQFYEIETRDVSISELADAGEVFVTSTSRQILPVRSVDGYTYRGENRVVTNHLMDLIQSP
ncbi:MAG TPA: aminotransferase class IV [Flavisolibacter sp.]